MLRIKIANLTKQQYEDIKLFEELIQEKIDENRGTLLYDYYLQMSDCSGKIKDYSK